MLYVSFFKVTMSCLALCNLMNGSLPGSSLSMRFPRQEYWSRLQFPSPENLPKPGVKPASPAWAGGFRTAESQQCC